MNKLSIVVSAYNEEQNIEDCLKSVKDLASEIIVIDNNSGDKTGEIAKKFTERVFTQENNPTKIDLQKNFGFSKATQEWILSLDADERVTAELAEEIKSIVNGQSSMVNGYWIPRKNIIFGKWIKSDMWWPDYQLRLFRKGKGKFGKETVHTALTVDGETRKLENFLIHENYKTVGQYIEKLNNYTTIEADNLANDGYKFTWLDSIRFPVDDFVKTFFLQKGYSDGLHGLVLSMLQAFYMEVVFAKLWEKRKFEEFEDANFVREVGAEMIDSANKVKYWFLHATIKMSKNPFSKVLMRAKRKFVKSKIKTYE